MATGIAAVLMLTAAEARAQTAADYTAYTQYDAMRRPTLKVGPLAGGLRRVEKTVYDADGQVIETDLGTATAASIDAAGNIGLTGLMITQTTTVRYDAAGNKTQILANSGTASATLTQTSYDGANRATCVAVRMKADAFANLYSASDRPDACALTTAGTQGSDRITRTTYDLAGQVTRVDQAVGTADARIYARYAYTLNGKQSEIVDANGNRTTLAYDGFDRLDRQVFPAAARPDPGQVGASNQADYEQYGYDASGNRTALRKRDGTYIRYCYDALNRQTIKRATSNVTDCAATGAVDDVFTSYDLAGKVLSARFGSAGGQGVVYSYDTAGRVSGEASFGRALVFELDAADNRTKMTWPDGNYAVYGYDPARHQTFATAGAGTVSFGYDGLGRRVLDTRSGGWTTHYCYDVADRLTGWGIRLAGGELGAGPTCATISDKAAAGFATQGGANKDQAEAFGYNPAGQVISHARANGVYQWQLTATGLSATADGLNRDAAIAAAGGYDANQNLTKDSGRVFAYDRENRLVAMTGPAAAGLQYDPLGRLTKATVNGVVTQFLYDGDQLVAEYDGAGAVLRRYVHGAGADDPLLWFEGAGLASPRYLHADRQGSIIGWSDASGVSQAVYTYGPYGEPGDNWGAGPRFRYTGQAALPELKLYHYKARVYDPARGWFLQTDPIGYKDDLNWYAYVGNDPLNGTDPTGQMGEIGSYGSDGTYYSPGARPESEGKAHGLGDVVKLTTGFAGITAGSLFAPSAVASVGSLVLGNAPAATQATAVLADALAPGAGIGAGVAAAGSVRGGENTAASIGRQAHADFAAKVAAKPGWVANPRLVGASGKVQIPDARTAAGRLVELKPNTESGIRAGVRQAQRYLNELGEKVRVIYYDPNNYK